MPKPAVSQRMPQPPHCTQHLVTWRALLPALPLPPPGLLYVLIALRGLRHYVGKRRSCCKQCRASLCSAATLACTAEASVPRCGAQSSDLRTCAGWRAPSLARAAPAAHQGQPHVPASWLPDGAVRRHAEACTVGREHESKRCAPMLCGVLSGSRSRSRSVAAGILPSIAFYIEHSHDIAYTRSMHRRLCILNKVVGSRQRVRRVGTKRG